MTNHGDKNDPFNSDDDFENFLADLAGSAEAKKAAPPMAKAPEPAAASAPAPVPLGVDRDLDFDDDDDGATRVGQIPAELLLALGRKPAQEPERPASDARPTDRPPAADADETEVELDDFGDLSLDRVESLAPPIGTHEAAPAPQPAPTTPPVSDRPTLGFDDPLTAPTKAPPSQSVPRPVMSLNEELARASARAGSIPPTDSPSAVARLRSLELDDPLDSVPPPAPSRAIVPPAAAQDDDDLEIEAGGDPVVLGGDDDDDAEVSVDAGGEEIILGDDDDEISIDSGGDEVILDADDDEPPAAKPAPALAPAVATVAPRRVAPPILTLSGRDLLAARARMLATLASDAKGDALESAYLAAAELGERAKLPDTDTWLESAAAGSAVARRILARRGRRAVRSLTRDSLGADVAALDAMLDSVVLARSDESPLASLEQAIELAHSTQLKRLAAAAAADVATKAGDSTKAATLRLSTLGDDQPTSTTLAAARRLRALGSQSGTGTALAHASQRTPRPEVSNALARWSDLFSGAKTAPDDDGSPGALDARLASETQRESALLALAELGDADDRAHFMALAAERAVARGAIDTARARFEDARRLTSRSGFVDALRDAAAARVGDASILPPTPVHDADDAPIAAVGRACTLPEVSAESLLAVRAVLDLPRAAATAARLLADIAANLGEPTEWVDALALERRAAPVGGAGIDVSRALVFARAGDRAAAIEAVREAESGVAATARALLSVSRDLAAAARLLSPDATASNHDLALRTRLDRAASLDTFQHALAESPNDPFLALRLEQAARRDSNATAETDALSALARLADDETDRTKFRLLSSSAAQHDESTLDLAPNDPILLAEALLGRTVAPAVRDRAVATLAAKAPAIVLATLHARSSTLMELDGSPADAAMQLRQAHEALPNEPSMRVSLELAELAADQSVRVAHRLFATARSEADDPTRARAFARLADLDRHETGDASAALASLLAVNELAPHHVPTLRALEALGRDRSDTANAAAVETRLASALVPGRSADAHARMAIRLIVAASSSPSTDIRVVALNALARGTTSTRLLRWAEHAARTTADGRELLALERRVASAADDAERVELLARIAAHAERRGDFERARVALDDAFARDPSHTAIAIERATLLDSSDENGSAAVAHEAAAALCHTEAQAIVHLLRAAEHHEANGANDRARTVLETAHERSPSNPAILEALSGALERWADYPRALETLERRIELGGDPAELLPAHRKRAALAERLGRADVARVAYDDILAIEPTDGQVLQRAAELAIAAEDGRAAVDALIRLARIERDPAALVAIFRALGDAYERLSPDPRRAEASYRRVLQLEPADAIANQQLVGILNAQSRWPDSLIVVDAFDAAAPGSRLAQELRFSVARGLEGSGDARQAEQLLEGVRKAAPTDAAIVLEMARFYERQGAKPALSMHLNRAAADLRRAFEEAPSRAPLEGLLEVHRLRARADAFACAAATAATLGVSHALQGQALRDHVDGAGKRANDVQVDEVVAPRSLPDGTRGVLRLAGEAIERAFPFDARPFKTEKLGKDVPIRTEALRAAELFGFDDVVVLVTAAAPRICVPVSAHPFTIVMGRELPVITTEREREFLFVRAAKIAASGLSFAMRLQGAQVAQAMFALVRAHDPQFAPPGIDVATLEEPARVIAKATSNQSALGALCLEMAARPSFEPHRFGIAAAEWSDRIALVATGQTHAGVSALLRLGGHDLDTATDFDSRLRLVRAMPEAFGLLAFSLSDAHAEARVRAGIARG